MNAARVSPVQGLRRTAGSMSLEVKLPLLMSVVLAAVMAVSLIVTVSTLQRVARQGAAQRVIRAVHEIVTSGAATLPATTARYRAVGADSIVQRVLADQARGRRNVSPSDARSLRTALRSMTLPTDSGMPIELWTPDGVRVALVGNDLRPTPTPNARLELPGEVAAPAAVTDSGTDALRFTPMYGDSSRVFFWIVFPVQRDGRTVGYIAHQRRLAIGPATQRTVRELSGDSVSLYYRNTEGVFWATGTHATNVPLLTPLPDVPDAARLPGGERALYHEERFAATPIMVGMYLPLRTIDARTRRTARTLFSISVLLVAIGTLTAWAIGRSVARPLGDLTRAASAIAAGDFAVRAPNGNDLEVQRLAASFNHMAAELGSSRGALERQTQEAQSANRAKSEFLTTMSHELRTPLNAIGGYVDLLEMGLRGPVTEEQRRDLLRIKTSQEHLLGLISGVLDLSRIEAGRVSYTFTTLPVDALLHGMDALVAPQAAAKTVTLEHVPADHALTVVADREKLRQVLLNLLSNAVRHTPAGGTVTLSSEPRGSRVAIMVDDTGPGIPAERREMIFEPFVQLDRSLTQNRDGLGLGLAISRDLARGMAGDLEASVSPAGGARFVVLLPRGEAADALGADSGEVPAVRAR